MTIRGQYKTARMSCVGCGEEFGYSPHVRYTRRFCTRKCYNLNSHLRNKSSKPNQHNYPAGTRFGRLTTLSLSSKGNIRCLCDCGVETIQRSASLGRVMSCGCYNREKGRLYGPQTAWNKLIKTHRNVASRRGISSELTDERIVELSSSDCSYCSAPPRKWECHKNHYLLSARGKNTKTPDLDFADSKVIFVNGIDRVDSNRGYTNDNCVACCKDCNTAKLNMSVEDFKAWSIRLYNNFGSK